MRRKGHTITSLTDRDANGKTFLFTEIDPFTFLAVANRGLTEDKRYRILEAMKQFFGIAIEVPKEYTGVPVMMAQNSWFMSFAYLRESSHVSTLWRVFSLALRSDPLQDSDFQEAFDLALKLRGVNFNLTMGLFWIRPRAFLSLDGNIRKYLRLQIPTEGLSFAYYGPLVKRIAKEHPEGFPKLSHDAWVSTGAAVVTSEHLTTISSPAVVREPPVNAPQTNYWMVGAWWSDREPQDQTQRFREEGIWENGFTDRLLDQVRAMLPGDRIAIKSAGTQKLNLPFDYRGKTASRMMIKATGTILKNRNDGRVVEAEWDPPEPERPWFFYTGRSTVWRLDRSIEYAKRLIRFAFNGEEQDYNFFLKEWEGIGLARPAQTAAISVPVLPYSIDDIIAEGVFLGRDELKALLRRLHTKKNLILDGAPGVGKTFLARKLAYALLEERDDSRIRSVQFHPSYSYEDFVRGYRPGSDRGVFELQNGPLLEICDKAENNPDDAYVLLIDEVNRGNTSQIFGELLGLLEADKRGAANAVTPIYRRRSDETLSIPDNLYVIGTMNLADRSLALVDYALRRRFAFVTLEPRFESAEFRSWHADRKMNLQLLQRVITNMLALNETITGDAQLGPNFRIGHSFFLLCPPFREAL